MYVVEENAATNHWVRVDVGLMIRNVNFPELSLDSEVCGGLDAAAEDNGKAKYGLKIRMEDPVNVT